MAVAALALFAAVITRGPVMPVAATVVATQQAAGTLPVAALRPLAVFLGDSYTQGLGASSESTRWVNMTASAKGWDFVNLGRGGSGYFTPSTPQACFHPVCPNYAGMIPEVAAESPDYIVVAGGQNDFSAFDTSRQRVVEAIRTTYAALRASFPHAQIIAIGPSTSSAVTPDVELFDRVVQDAAASVHAQYVSLIDPNVIGDGMFFEDKIHVNDAGHKAIAKRIIAAVR
ncbi:GDSL-type esterase/lipase family protein [Arthrobacter sp.]|uniref:SGNH/GDSL hydrolase family protein n=1 Tax=Arthrobacter sp. TaxID=1667 RepID=UPI00339B7E59